MASQKSVPIKIIRLYHRLKANIQRNRQLGWSDVFRIKICN